MQNVFLLSLVSPSLRVQTQPTSLKGKVPSTCSFGARMTCTSQMQAAMAGTGMYGLLFLSVSPFDTSRLELSTVLIWRCTGRNPSGVNFVTMDLPGSFYQLQSSVQFLLLCSLVQQCCCCFQDSGIANFLTLRFSPPYSTKVYVITDNRTCIFKYHPFYVLPLYVMQT